MGSNKIYFLFIGTNVSETLVIFLMIFLSQIQCSKYFLYVTHLFLIVYILPITNFTYQSAILFLNHFSWTYSVSLYNGIASVTVGCLFLVEVMASSIITVISACVLVSSVCTVYTINAENIFSSPATDLPSQNAQLLEACFNLCRWVTQTSRYTSLIIVICYSDKVQSMLNIITNVRSLPDTNSSNWIQSYVISLYYFCSSLLEFFFSVRLVLLYSKYNSHINIIWCSKTLMHLH